MIVKKAKKKKYIIASLILLSLTTLLLVLGPKYIDPSQYRLEDSTASNLTSLKLLLDKYHEEHGAYPSTAEGLGKLFSEGYVKNSRIDIDPWGEKLVYKLHDGVVTLYSTGENKLDENKGGDDIALDY